MDNDAIFWISGNKTITLFLFLKGEIRIQVKECTRIDFILVNQSQVADRTKCYDISHAFLKNTVEAVKVWFS